jgi:hypothetical protein
MKMTTKDVEQLRSAFAVCRSASIDAVMITDNQIRGVSTPSGKMAIISKLDLSFDSAIKIGIGRLAELEKRLSIFSTELDIDVKVNDNNEASLLTIASGKSKIQFRCTAERLIKYPKTNEDEDVCVVRASKGEISQMARAVKTLSAESLTLAIGRDNGVRFECTSPTNETYVSSLETSAAFVDAPQAIVNKYEGDKFASVLDAAARDVDELDLVIGAFGSITISMKGHTLIAMPEVNEEDDDE